jgi:hypothetical protein
MKSRVKRFAMATTAGVVLAIVYWTMLLTNGFDVIQRFSPMLAAAINISVYPSELLLLMVNGLNLPPHGDAGFVWFLILPGLQWILIGIFSGFVLAVCSKK